MSGRNRNRPQPIEGRSLFYLQRGYGVRYITIVSVLDMPVSQENCDVRGVWSVSSFSGEHLVINVLQSFVKAFSMDKEGRRRRQKMQHECDCLTGLIEILIKRDDAVGYAAE